MLVINDFGNFIERARCRAVVAGENGNQLGEVGVNVFSLQFRQFIQAIADFNLPGITPYGRYVCRISSGCEPVKTVWFEPGNEARDPALYEVCLLTNREINIEEDGLEKLWQTFMEKIREGMATLARQMLDEADAYRDRFGVCAEIVGKLNRASDIREAL